MDWDVQCDELAECEVWAEWQAMRQAELESDLDSCWEEFWQEVRDAAQSA